tara:strand:- start:161 stop:967 length:807 start_codon:yes stop_codon:yes gene_type:complete
MHSPPATPLPRDMCCTMCLSSGNNSGELALHALLSFNYCLVSFFSIHSSIAIYSSCKQCVDTFGRNNRDKGSQLADHRIAQPTPCSTQRSSKRLFATDNPVAPTSQSADTTPSPCPSHTYVFPLRIISAAHPQHHAAPHSPRPLTLTLSQDQGAPPQYPQSPPPAHYDAGPAPGGMQPYYNQGAPANQDYYGNSPNPYQQQGQGYGPPQGYGQPQQGYGQPQQGMHYQQGPPPQGMYPQQQKGSSAGGGLFAGLCAGLACCCCLDCLF